MRAVMVEEEKREDINARDEHVKKPKPPSTVSDELVGKKVSVRALGEKEKKLNDCDLLHDTFMYYHELPLSSGGQWLNVDTVRECCE